MDTGGSLGSDSSLGRASLVTTDISQEACLCCKPRAAFNSRLAGHASSISVCLGSGKARTCMTLHVPGHCMLLYSAKRILRGHPPAAIHRGKPHLTALK